MASICKSILGRNLRDLEVTNRSSGDAWIQTDLVLPHIQMLVVPLDPPPAIDLHLCVVVDQGHFHGVPRTGLEVGRAVLNSMLTGFFLVFLSFGGFEESTLGGEISKRCWPWR